VNGTPGCASSDLLQKRLREQWGFAGYVVSDCGAVDDIHRNHKFTSTLGAAAVSAVKAGTDLTCGMEYRTLVEEVKAGRISEAEIQARSSHAGRIDGRTWRQARNAGAFSYRLATKDVAPDEPLALACVFGARDKDRPFTILVDGTPLASPELDHDGPGVVRIETFPIPPNIRRERSAFTVTFQAADRWDAATANVFGCAARRAGDLDSSSAVKR
jgi:hypothetical protein